MLYIYTLYIYKLYISLRISPDTEKPLTVALRTRKNVRKKGFLVSCWRRCWLLLSTLCNDVFSVHPRFRRENTVRHRKLADTAVPQSALMHRPVETGQWLSASDVVNRVDTCTCRGWPDSHQQELSLLLSMENQTSNQWPKSPYQPSRLQCRRQTWHHF